jgi:hypothetical protein
MDKGMKKYRIVEYKPGLFTMQRRWLFGWGYCRDYEGGKYIYRSAEEAEAHVRSWIADQNHTLRVVKEL